MNSYRLLLTLPAFLAAVSLQGAITITSENFTYSQDFNTLPTSSEGATLEWTNNSTIPGWHQAYTGAVTESTEWSFQVVPSGTGLVTDGGITTNTSVRFANLGHANSTDRSVGLYRPFSLTGSVGAVFQNNSGTPLPGFEIGYTGEQWRRGGTEETPLYFEYKIVADVDGLNINSAPENWTRVDALQFDSPKFDGGGLNMDGKWPDYRTVIDPVAIMDSIPEGAYLVTRWFQDRTNSAGESTSVYHMLAIDDVSMAVIPEPSHFALAFGAFGLLLMIVRRRRITDR